MILFCKRVLCFLRFVWRRYEGGRIALSTAWELAVALEPSAAERAARHQAIREWGRAAIWFKGLL